MSSSAKKRPKRKVRDPSQPPRVLIEPPSGLFPTKEELLRLFAVIAIAGTIAFACNYAAGIFSRRHRPFCDSDLDTPSDVCEPCPDKGECSNGQLECFRGYNKHGRKCIEDGQIDQMAKKFSEWLERYVCESYACSLCYGTGAIWFKEVELSNMFDDYNLKENTGLKNDSFMLSKCKAMKAVERSLETRTVIDGIREFKCPDLMAELHRPLLCSIQQWIYKHILLVLPVTALVVGVARFSQIVCRKHYLSTRAEHLYDQICEILEENAQMAKSKNNEGEPWVVASWLRDHLLSPRERKDNMLWKKVEELIQEDSRIDQYPKLIKGESKIVLEWQVEGSLSSKMRTKRASVDTKVNRPVGITSHYKQNKLLAGYLNVDNNLSMPPL